MSVICPNCNSTIEGEIPNFCPACGYILKEIEKENSENLINHVEQGDINTKQNEYDFSNDQVSSEIIDKNRINNQSHKKIIIILGICLITIVCILFAFIKLKYEVLNTVGEDSPVSEDSETTNEKSTSSTTDSKKKKYIEIFATYDGSTEAGTVIDATNEGIHVTAKYKYTDGTDGTEDITEFYINEPATLKVGETTTVTIAYKGLFYDLEVTCTTDEATYKAQCQSISYDELARKPDTYIGRSITIYGQVLQVQEDSDTVELRIGTSNSGYGNYYDDVVYVVYTYKAGEAKILEDDFVTVYGTYTGTYTYTTVMGDAITIPSILFPEFIDRK